MTIETLEHRAIKRKWPLKGGKGIMWALRLPHLIALRELPSHVERGNWDEYQQTQRVEKWKADRVHRAERVPERKDVQTVPFKYSYVYKETTSGQEETIWERTLSSTHTGLDWKKNLIIYLAIGSIFMKILPR